MYFITEIHIKMRENYNVNMHITPELKVYIGVSDNTRGDRWRMASTYRGNIEFYNASAQFGWGAINHRIIEDGLTKARAKDVQKKLIEAAGGQCYNTYQRTANFSNYSGNEVKLTQKPSNMKKEKQQIAKSKTIGGIKVEIVLDTRFLHKDGTYPVCIRVYHNRKYKYIGTQYSMSCSEFKDMNQNDEQHIAKLFENYCEQVRGFVADGFFDMDMLKKVKAGETTADKTLSQLVLEKASLLNMQSTANNYRSTVKVIDAYYPNGLKLSLVNAETIGKLKAQMQAQGYTNATINIHLSIIRASINYGIYKGYMKPEQYPFKRQAMEVDKVVIPQSDKRDENYLSKTDMQEIWTLFKATKNKKLGYFMFSYLHGGMNIADMMGLRFTDFYFQEGGFVYKREKTKGKNKFKTVVPATTWTSELLDIMGITPEKGELVFKEMECDDAEYGKKKASFSNTINHYLDGLDVVGKHISMTTARHSFATIATKERMPFAMVERAMGHSLGGVSSHYIGGFDVAEMRQDFEKLL